MLIFERWSTKVVYEQLKCFQKENNGRWFWKSGGDEENHHEGDLMGSSLYVHGSL